MNLTSAQLDSIEQYAGLFLSAEEISILLDIDYDLLSEELQDEMSEVRRRYLKGKLKMKVILREKIIALAQKGSPQAEIFAQKFIEKSDLKDLWIIN